MPKENLCSQRSGRDEPRGLWPGRVPPLPPPPVCPPRCSVAFLLSSKQKNWGLS